MLRGSWEPGRDTDDWTWGPVAAGPRPSRGCGQCLTGDGFLEAEGAGPVEDGVGAGPPGGRAGAQRPWGVASRRWRAAGLVGRAGEAVRPRIWRRAAGDGSCF